MGDAKILMYNYSYCHPEKIEFFEDDVPMHDIDVEDDHSFLIEGGYVVHNSAAGTACDARSKQFQAVLPLRGKVLNVSKTTLNKALENKEIGTLISALGVTVTPRDVLVDDIRYQKVVILSDADPDGGHIACLLITLFHKFMRKIIEEGFLYTCELPLFKVVHKGKSQYLKDDKALDDFKKQYPGDKMEVSRFKGLGEMSVEELEETAMNPTKRVLRKIQIEDNIEAENLIEQLMGDDAQGRKDFLAEHLKFEENL